MSIQGIFKGGHIMTLRKTNSYALGNAYRVTVDGKSIIVLCDGGEIAIKRFFWACKVDPQVKYLHNIEADILGKTLETFELIRTFIDESDRIFTYDDLWAEWLSADFAETRERWENDFDAYLLECTRKNGGLREV
jgi:hypothetical protein